jgi:predicted phosphodiesterase
MARRIPIAALACVFALLLLTAPTEATLELTEVVPLWGPYLTAASETSMTVNWRTENATNGSVFYATETYFNTYGDYNNVISDSSREMHHVQLTGLTPDTTYHYRLQIEGEFTADHAFTTFGSGSFTFIVYGDTQEQLPTFTQLERHKLVADRIAAEEDVSFILHCGDVVGDVDNPEEWNRFFQITRDVLAETPIFTVLGNHEENSTNYYDTFGVPEWYSFDCSNAHFAMLDSNMLDSVQAEWLAQDLNNDATWKFAVFHHPLYSSVESHWGGWLNLQTAWEPEFVANGVNAVFNGHVHVYERYYESGIHCAVLGIGGGPCYSLAEEKIDGYRNSFGNTLGYARVTVNGGEASMDVIKVAEIHENEVSQIYPPNTIFETVNLAQEQLSSSASLTATTTLNMQMVGIDLDRDSIDYGDVAPGASSEVETVLVTNVGTVDCDVSLEVVGADVTAQDFYEQSLYVDGGLYDVDAVVASILVDGSEDVDTQLQVPLSWGEVGVQEATFVFWAEAA